MAEGFKRAVIVVFDGLGIGELPDAQAVYNDGGSDTLDNTARAVGGLHLPNLCALGLGLIEGVDEIDKVLCPIGSWGRAKEASPGKDTATGHWEMSGVAVRDPFPVYLDGFPPEIMDGFTAETGYGYLGGKAASGTDIIELYGEEHLRTKKLIVYTSADSVFQIAAHEELVPLEELYEICRKTRKFLDRYRIGRVIARPFTGKPGSFQRTPWRKDFAVEPPGETVLERLKAKGLQVVGIGKIGDIFVHKGLTLEVHTVSDDDGMDRTKEALSSVKEGLIFTNLVDFDTLYGHRNDPAGYAKELEKMDRRIPELIDLLGDDDILFITGDHGCDPTTPSTDHSREFVPLLVYGKGLKKGVDLGTRETFSDLGATIAELFNAGPLANGSSFLSALIK